MKKTKVIATIGPASKDESVLRALINAGMNVARINMTHSSHQFAEDVIKRIRKIDKELGKNTGILIDLKGPDITVNSFEGGSAYLNTGDKIRIYDDDTLIGDETKFSVSYNYFVRDIKTGTTIKLNDGLLELLVLEKGPDYLLCEVKVGGFIENYKGVNVINTHLNIPFLSKKDKEDIKFADKMNADFLALSFVSSYEDVLEVNDYLIDIENDRLSLISKIENELAVEDLDNIISNSDGIMIARGDLGVELPMERVPGIQKKIISKCHMEGKYSIVATEMMSSMETIIRPTRAEVSDVANAILDGIDVVMLSGETTVGKYPVETLETMVKIIEATELDVNYYGFLDTAMRTENQDITGTIAYNVVLSADKMKAKLIMAPTMTGYTARRISRFRPMCPIIALSPDEKVIKNLSVYYGIYPILIGKITTFDKMLEKINDIVKELGLKQNDKYLITGGYPFNEVKNTNFMKIEEIR